MTAGRDLRSRPSFWQTAQIAESIRDSIRIPVVTRGVSNRLAPMRWLEASEFHLFASVSRLKLVSNGQNEDDVFGRKPSVLCDVSITAAREDEFAPARLSGSPEQRMIRQELERLADAQNLLKCSLRVFGGDEVKESLEVGERAMGYFDRRHARALGRRALAPDARAAR